MHPGLPGEAGGQRGVRPRRGLAPPRSQRDPLSQPRVPHRDLAKLRDRGAETVSSSGGREVSPARGPGRQAGVRFPVCGVGSQPFRCACACACVCAHVCVCMRVCCKKTVLITLILLLSILGLLLENKDHSSFCSRLGSGRERYQQNTGSFSDQSEECGGKENRDYADRLVSEARPFIRGTGAGRGHPCERRPRLSRPGLLHSRGSPPSPQPWVRATGLDKEKTETTNPLTGVLLVMRFPLKIHCNSSKLCF